MYGGQAGGGKSEALLLGAARFVHEPTYRALLLRRTFAELEDTIWDRSFEYYFSLGGYPNKSKHLWTFPSGAKILFRSMEHELDRLKFKSLELQYVGFDELTSFLESQFVYLLSRLRSSKGLPCFIRAGTNPGGEGHDWVLRRYAPWLYPPGEHLDEYSGPYAKPGEVLYFRRLPDDSEEIVPAGTPGALSRVFFPASIDDNPSIHENDPEYVTRLQGQDRLTRKQLLGGDWMARAAPGEFFDREWFKLVDRGPENLAVGRVRYWDRAATEAEKKARRQSVKDTGPDWTVGVLMSKDRAGAIFVEDVVRFRAGPAEVQKRIRDTAEKDRERWGQVRTVLEQDPAQAGKFEVQHYTRHTLAGFDVRAKAPQGNKIARAKPWSAQAEAGNAHLLRAQWNRAYLDEHEMFPLGKKDQIDASSGGYSELVRAGGGGGKVGKPGEMARGGGGF